LFWTTVRLDKVLKHSLLLRLRHRLAKLSVQIFLNVVENKPKLIFSDRSIINFKIDTMSSKM